MTNSDESNPGLQHLTVPEEYCEHPLLVGRPFFIVPEKLLELLAQRIGQDRFDSELWDLELGLSKSCGGPDGVGFWATLRIQYPLLRYQPLEVSEADTSHIKGLGWSAEQIKSVPMIGQDRLSRFATVARGYAGWLLTNRPFLEEQDALLQDWSAEVAENRIPQMGTVRRGAGQLSEAVGRPAESRIEPFCEAFEAFFVRWRLTGLVAPFLPSPLEPQLPVIHLPAILGHMRHGGQSFYLPDTFPVPSRDELREIMEDALRGAGVPAHLSEWAAKVQAGNAAKNTILRYARLFELQHYLRVLYGRHATALHQRKTHLQLALATFLTVSEESISKDMAFIAEQLGEEWYLHPTPSW